jgi:RNA polymerase sigma-70 factor (ECF subfamily)
VTSPPSRALDGLMLRMAEGDERAFAAFYDATASMVFGLLVRMLGDRTRAEEVTQEVYLQAWRSADRFDPARGSAWSWLSMLARSRAMDRGRSEVSYRRALDGLEVRPMEQPLGTSPEPPDALAEMNERRAQVHQALAALPPEQRSLVEAAFLEGETHREIADRTGIPLGTVKSRIRSGLQGLERVLGGSRRVGGSAS